MRFLVGALLILAGGPAAGLVPDHALDYVIANVGQTDPEVRFFVRNAGYTAFFTSREVVFRAQGRADGEAPVVRQVFVGANPDPTVDGAHPLTGEAHFFIGDDPARWRTNVSTWKGVRYCDLYPGVDLLYEAEARRLKSTYVVAPGADPGVIAVRYAGTNGVRVRDDGALVVGGRNRLPGGVRSRQPSRRRARLPRG